MEAFGRYEWQEEEENPTLLYPEILGRVLKRMATGWGVYTTPEDIKAFGRSVGNWPAFQDSPLALAYLKQHYKLVILSNVDRASCSLTNARFPASPAHSQSISTTTFSPERRTAMDAPGGGIRPASARKSAISRYTVRSTCSGSRSAGNSTTVIALCAFSAMVRTAPASPPAASGKIGGNASGVDNAVLEMRGVLVRGRICAAHGTKMSCSRAVAILATYGQFGKRFALKTSIRSGHRIWPATMAEDAARRNRSVKTQISKLISRRGRPFHGFGIERQRRLKEKIVFSEDCAVSIDSRADDPIDRVRASEALLSVGPDSRFALKKNSILGVDFESPVEPFM